MALNGETITLTFCDSGENHVGMKMLGKKVDEGEGYSLEDLERIRYLQSKKQSKDMWS